mgnify:CR=1 FL=1
MIEMTKYADHDVDADPVIVLSCNHFFSTSTLDGHFNAVENTEIPRGCPECRSPIDKVYRYGRRIRLIELRALERKHLASIQQALDSITDSMETDKAFVKTKSILNEIQNSPMQKIFEASRGVGLDVPRPPAGQEDEGTAAAGAGGDVAGGGGECGKVGVEGLGSWGRTVDRAGELPGGVVPGV